MGHDHEDQDRTRSYAQTPYLPAVVGLLRMPTLSSGRPLTEPPRKVGHNAPNTGSRTRSPGQQAGDNSGRTSSVVGGA